MLVSRRATRGQWMDVTTDTVLVLTILILYISLPKFWGDMEVGAAVADDVHLGMKREA